VLPGISEKTALGWLRLAGLGQGPDCTASFSSQFPPTDYMFCGFIVSAIVIPRHFVCRTPPTSTYPSMPNTRQAPISKSLPPAPSCSNPPLKAFPFRPAAHASPESPPFTYRAPFKVVLAPATSRPPFLHPRPLLCDPEYSSLPPQPRPHPTWARRKSSSPQVVKVARMDPTVDSWEWL
jgi:hypothetical protein